jgi:hypothetical protein
MTYRPVAWFLSVLLGLVLAPAFAFAVVLPSSGGFVSHLQNILYPAIGAVARSVDFDLVAIGATASTDRKLSASVQTTTTSTPTKLTGGGKTAGAPSVFGFNVHLNPDFTLDKGHWNSQSPRCNGPVTAIFPQPDDTNGFNFDVDCGGSTLHVRANDNGEPGSGPSTTPADCNTPGKPDCLDLNGPFGEPTQQITNGNIQAHH